MNVDSYRRRQAEIQAKVAFEGRRLPCKTCLQPHFSCYCQLLKPFDPGIMFVILIHPIEVARRIATGRMAHLCLKNSRLISGHDFSQNQSVNEILKDDSIQSLMLYPGAQSRNIEQMNAEEKRELKSSGKKLALFVIDGTWNTARKTVHVSENLKNLPRVCFTPNRPSNFRIRKQPRPECYSTIEAIHQTIDLLSPTNREHDHLLYVFEKMVARQLELAHSKTWSPWESLAIPSQKAI